MAGQLQPHDDRHDTRIPGGDQPTTTWGNRSGLQDALDPWRSLDANSSPSECTSSNPSLHLLPSSHDSSSSNNDSLRPFQHVTVRPRYDTTLRDSLAPPGNGPDADPERGKRPGTSGSDVHPRWRKTPVIPTEADSRKDTSRLDMPPPPVNWKDQPATYSQSRNISRPSSSHNSTHSNTHTSDHNRFSSVPSHYSSLHPPSSERPTTSMGLGPPPAPAPERVTTPAYPIHGARAHSAPVGTCIVPITSPSPGIPLWNTYYAPGNAGISRGPSPAFYPPGTPIPAPTPSFRVLPYPIPAPSPVQPLYAPVPMYPVAPPQYDVPHYVQNSGVMPGYDYAPAPTPPDPARGCDQPSSCPRLILPDTSKAAPLLEKSDYVTWRQGIINILTTITAFRAMAHIIEPSGRKTAVSPTYPPDMPSDSEPTPDQQAAHDKWWAEDGVVWHVLWSTLGPAPRIFVPARMDGEGNWVATSRDLFRTLFHRFGGGDASSARAIKAGLKKTKCGSSYAQITSFIATWRISLGQLNGTGFEFSKHDAICHFLENLPAGVAYENFQRVVDDDLDQPGAQHNLPDIFAIIDAVERIAAGEHNRAKLQRPTPDPSKKSNSRSSRSSPKGDRPTCSFCNIRGHTEEKCYKKRDQLQGTRPPSKGVKGQAHVATVDSSTPDVSSATSGNDTQFKAYDPVCYPSEECHLSTALQEALATHDFKSNMLLDSGCTSHIFSDRAVFWSYDDRDPPSVGTADCGTLRTFGRGEVRIKLQSVSGEWVTVQLSNCLHAPNVPVNLISVGQFSIHGHEVRFSCGTTSLHLGYHSDSPVVVPAVTLGTLSFLDGGFLFPPSPDVPVRPPGASKVPAFLPLDPVACLSLAVPDAPTELLAMEADGSRVFPKTVLDSDLWHRRFGHVGIDTVRKARKAVDGMVLDGPIVDQNCVSCITAKRPQQPYASPGNRPSHPCELISFDTCGPFPISTPYQTDSFLAFLDHYTTYTGIGLSGSRTGSSTLTHFKSIALKWSRQSGFPIVKVRSDCAPEFVGGELQKYLLDNGITHQQTVPYAHQQNGSIERYIRTVEEAALAMLADSGLPLSFLGDAVLTASYVRNRLPNSVLPPGVTPYERMHGRKPDVTSFRVFGSRCFPLVPAEIRSKGAPKRFEAIFVGYEEDRLGYRVRDLNGKYHFSRDVIFDENSPGKLSRRLKGVSAAPDAPIEGVLGEVIAHRDRQTRSGRAYLAHQAWAGIQDFAALAQASSFAHPPTSVLDFELELALEFAGLSTSPKPASARNPPLWDLSKPPANLKEAMARPDSDVWVRAMGREYGSLQQKSVFRSAFLPDGRGPITLIWVFAYKYDADGNIRRGEEKARLVVQGCKQRPEDYGETASPVASMSNWRSLLALANAKGWFTFSFDISTAFLHAPLHHTVYAARIPGSHVIPDFVAPEPGTVLEITRALYGLKQAGYEWYCFFRDVLTSIGFSICETDRAVFFAEFDHSPDPSVEAPAVGSPLVIIIALHVDDGGCVTNSESLYLWVVSRIGETVAIKDGGEIHLHLSIRIDRDFAAKKLWLSQPRFIDDLLRTHNMEDATPHRLPLSTNLSKLAPAPPNAVPDVPDSDLKVTYQSIVGSLQYLACCTRPDLSYTAMALGQYSANPTRTHLLAAKGVLRYLRGTSDWALEYSASSDPHAKLLVPVDCAFMDADWASDEDNRRSISGYAFFFHGALVSWSATKQRTVALSSTEAEYMSMAHAMKEAIRFRLFTANLNFEIPRPFPLYSDNKGAIAIATSPTISTRSKHIDVRYHFLREHLTTGSFTSNWIPTSDMTADILTKPLPSDAHYRHCKSLGLVTR